MNSIVNAILLAYILWCDVMLSGVEADEGKMPFDSAQGDKVSKLTI
jgi:hypothetical protein